MIFPWAPVIYIDILGSILTLILAIWCAILARDWTRQKQDDVFRQYIFLLTTAIVFFAISRSFGHLFKQIFLFCHMENIWQQISPFSGAINTVAFVVIFAFGIYFHRFHKIHTEVERYRNNLEDMITQRTAELEETNLTLAEEIKERKITALALKESQGYLQAILDHTNLLMSLKDASGSYILINKEYEHLTKLTNEEILGKKDFDVFPEPIAASFNAQDEEVKKANQPIEFEETLPIDGQEHTFITSKFPLRDAGTIYAIGRISTDISNRKQAEKVLAAEQERLAVTLRSIGDGVITTDTAGNIILLNKIAENLTGWSQEESFGKPFSEIFHLENINREQASNPVQTVISTGQIFSQDDPTILVSKNGRELFISCNSSPILDKDGRIIGVVLVFKDITHQLKLEEESIKVKKLESIGILAGGIAHDFNNILAAILGNINLARLDAEMKDSTQALLAEAEKASLRAKGLTQQLLTFSKGGEPVKETSSLQEVIKDSANFVLHGEKAACRYEIPDDLWLADIDKGQISQVIQNIIINANQAIPNGGIIDVTCENIAPGTDPKLPEDQCYVKITISDTGKGIPANMIDKIFDPYFSTKSKGAGLGLAICHSIITKHNGHIFVESKPGIGTAFTIILPASTNYVLKKETAKEIVADVSNTNILVMDDDDSVRRVARGMLTKLGCDVVEARDGKEAIEKFTEAKLSEKPIDLIIMDLTIPAGMGGKEAVKEILKIDPKAKVIVSSGYSNDPIISNHTEYGFCGAMSKPYSLDELTKAIGKTLP